ncbi:MAG TPA: hypothetical protein VGQ39_17470 [Pyrinomonadaceae bacterium]|nr:hypothetical protein [Pyrinomonadaceae bacterium]
MTICHDHSIVTLEYGTSNTSYEHLSRRELKAQHLLASVDDTSHSLREPYSYVAHDRIALQNSKDVETA